VIAAGVMPRVKAGMRARAGLSLLVVAGVALLVMPPELRDRFLKPGVNVSDAVRVRLAQVVMDALAEAPWTGIGTGGFSQLLRMGDIRAYPHNLAAEVLIENGVVGLAVLGAFVGLGLVRGFRLRGDPRGLMLLSCALFSLFNAMVSGDITTNEWIWLFGGILAGRARP
jgi:O-antigen ligase